MIGIENLVIEIIKKFGYIGTMILIALENIFPPLPSELILVFSGFITISLDLNIFIMILFSTFGSLIGALVLYYFGTIFNKDKIKLLLHTKYGRLLKLEDRDVDNANAWFEKKGYTAVILCRFIPVIRSLISIPAGMNKMNIMRFSIYTFMASFIWNSILLYLGLIFGDNWLYISELFSKYSTVVLILISLFSIYLIYLYISKRKK